MYGLLRSLKVNDDPVVRAYLHTWLGFHFAEGVPVNYFCGSWSIGLLLPEALELFPEFQIPIRATARRIHDFILRKALRNGEGILLHNVDLPNIYVDTVYYAAVTLSKVGPMLGLEWEDDAVRQIVLHLDRLQDGEKPFFIHCEENVGGHRSEGSWARGNGWVMMTLAEIIPLLEKGSTRRKDLTIIFRELARALARFQTSTGLWRTIVDDKSSYEETSATAMYLYAYQRGRAERILGDEFDSVLRKGFRALGHTVDAKGRVIGVSEGTWPGTAAYYKSLATGEWWWGTGAFLLAMTERELSE
jgi:unsaturated rhamnogalacturonyl hydrolase